MICFGILSDVQWDAVTTRPLKEWRNRLLSGTVPRCMMLRPVQGFGFNPNMMSEHLNAFYHQD